MNGGDYYNGGDGMLVGFVLVVDSVGYFIGVEEEREDRVEEEKEGMGSSNR